MTAVQRAALRASTEAQARVKRENEAYCVEVVEDATGAVVKSIGCVTQRQAERVEGGLCINLNHERHSLRPAPRKNAGRMPGCDRAWKKCGSHSQEWQRQSLACRVFGLATPITPAQAGRPGASGRLKSPRFGPWPGNAAAVRILIRHLVPVARATTEATGR